MADIFISYSQQAPEPTQALAADLMARRYSVWFDTRLLPKDTFGEVIDQKIDNAKAVIVIWSPLALTSKWVRGEATRGDNQKKLVCLRTAEVDATRLPTPFNLYNARLVTDRAAIYDALAELGAHPGGNAPNSERDAGEAALAWDHVKDSGDIELFEQFLKHYGEGHLFYGMLAKKKLAELSAGRSVPVVVARPAEVPLPQESDMFLRIDPGMHTAPIWRIGVNAAGTLLVTGSHDKTARLWALPQGGSGSPELVRTLRVPIGEGDDGKIYAVAISPDGQWVAAGGWDVGCKDYVYIFEAVTGRLVTRLGLVCDAINHLAFSPSGSRLAAAISGEGMRLWETAGWQLLAEDEDYGGKDSYGAAFDGANRLYTVADDGQIRCYGADGQLEAQAPTLGGGEPYSVAVHPGGGKLAIGFGDTTAVEVYDARSLKRLYAAGTGGISGGNVNKVAWSADGMRLYAGGYYREGHIRPVFIWQDEGRGKRSQAPLSQDTIMQLLPCGSGIAAATQDPAFGLIAADGARCVWQESVTANMRDKLRDAFTFSADGRRVRFGLGFGGEQPVLFDLAAFRLSDAAHSEAGLAQPKTSGLAISDWEDDDAPKLNGEVIALDDDETSRALAIAPDAQCYVLGTEYWLRAYRADGREIWKMPIPGIAWGVNVSGNGKLVVAAYGDGTIRWHRLGDGQELLALFVHAKDRRYIAWTPQGYYAASPGGEDLIGWHVNRGFDTAPDFYPASTFASTYNRPDIVKAALDV